MPVVQLVCSLSVVLPPYFVVEAVLSSACFRICTFFDASSSYIILFPRVHAYALHCHHYVWNIFLVMPYKGLNVVRRQQKQLIQRSKSSSYRTIVASISSVVIFPPTSCPGKEAQLLAPLVWSFRMISATMFLALILDSFWLFCWPE